MKFSESLLLPARKVLNIVYKISFNIIILYVQVSNPLCYPQPSVTCMDCILHKVHSVLIKILWAKMLGGCMPPSPETPQPRAGLGSSALQSSSCPQRPPGAKNTEVGLKAISAGKFEQVVCVCDWSSPADYHEGSQSSSGWCIKPKGCSL